MAKGSQLSQLKSALSQAGITRPPLSNKEKKRRLSAGQEQPDKGKRAAKLEEIHRKLNPFDVQVSRLKHDVVGRKLKGVTGRPAKSKQAGVEKRKKTLLKEYEERGHAGGIIDRRFGENDPTMLPEERMLARFTKERQRTSKLAAFNLEDEEELTHYGQSLSKLDDFDDLGPRLDDDDDEDDGQISPGVVKSAHFGGFGDDDEAEREEGQPARKKSKAEVMAEVIAKSKEHKHLRQLEREQEENIRHQLDQEFDSLRSLLQLPGGSFTRSPGSVVADDRDLLPPATTKDEDYDRNVRELAFDKRAQAKDRTKTEEEIAVEEKEALEKAERRRKRRMLGEDYDSDEEEQSARKKQRRAPVADDLGDGSNESEDGREEFGLGPGLTESLPRALESDDHSGEEDDHSGEEDDHSGEEDDHNGEEDEDDQSEEEGEEEDRESDSEVGDEDDEDCSDNDAPVQSFTDAHESGASDEDCDHSSGDEDGCKNEAVHKNNAKAKQKRTRELPYTFPCPSTHKEFLDILKGVSDEDLSTVVQRIRALHHPSLRPENASKLQTLISVLIDHVFHISGPPNPRPALLTSLLPHFFALTKAYPIPTARCFVSRLAKMHEELKRGLAARAAAAAAAAASSSSSPSPPPSSSPSPPAHKTWPSLGELTFLRLAGTLWPTSDRTHPVLAPARLLMGSYLGLGRVRTRAHLAAGLFLCTLFAQWEAARGARLVPEALNFLAGALVRLAPHRFENAAALPGLFPALDLFVGSGGDGAREDAGHSRGRRRHQHQPSHQPHLLALDAARARHVVVAVDRPDLVALISGGGGDDDDDDDDDGEQAKADLLGVVFSLVQRYAEMCATLPAFIELFAPVQAVLEGLEADALPVPLSTRLAALLATLTRLLHSARAARTPLRLQTHKPVPIPSHLPKFSMSGARNSSSVRHAHGADPDRARAAGARLRREVRDMRRGALRELRRDGRFLADVQRAARRAQDAAYARTMGRAHAELERERAEERVEERERARARRRAGR